jgi:hypothetical protein
MHSSSAYQHLSTLLLLLLVLLLVLLLLLLGIPKYVGHAAATASIASTNVSSRNSSGSTSRVTRRSVYHQCQATCCD